MDFTELDTIRLFDITDRNYAVSLWDKIPKKDTEDLTYNCLCTIWGSIHLTNVGYGRFHRCLSAGKGAIFSLISQLLQKNKGNEEGFLYAMQACGREISDTASFVRIAAAKLSCRIILLKQTAETAQNHCEHKR